MLKNVFINIQYFVNFYITVCLQFNIIVAFLHNIYTIHIKFNEILHNIYKQNTINLCNIMQLHI